MESVGDRPIKLKLTSRLTNIFKVDEVDGRDVNFKNSINLLLPSDR